VRQEEEQRIRDQEAAERRRKDLEERARVKAARLSAHAERTELVRAGMARAGGGPPRPDLAKANDPGPWKPSWFLAPVIWWFVCVVLYLPIYFVPEAEKNTAAIIAYACAAVVVLAWVGWSRAKHASWVDERARVRNWNACHGCGDSSCQDCPPGTYLKLNE